MHHQAEYFTWFTWWKGSVQREGILTDVRSEPDEVQQGQVRGIEHVKDNHQDLYRLRDEGTEKELRVLMNEKLDMTQ